MKKQATAQKSGDPEVGEPKGTPAQLKAALALLRIEDPQIQNRVAVEIRGIAGRYCAAVSTLQEVKVLRAESDPRLRRMRTSISNLLDELDRMDFITWMRLRAHGDREWFWERADGWGLASHHHVDSFGAFRPPLSVRRVHPGPRMFHSGPTPPENGFEDTWPSRLTALLELVQSALKEEPGRVGYLPTAGLAEGRARTLLLWECRTLMMALNLKAGFSRGGPWERFAMAVWEFAQDAAPDALGLERQMKEIKDVFAKGGGDQAIEVRTVRELRIRLLEGREHQTSLRRPIR